MNKFKFTKILLFLSGLIGISIGGALLFAPVAFEASAGIDLGDDINLLSEIRAPGGTLLIAGVIIMLGSFLDKITYFSLAISSLFYLSYGLSRIISIFLDGMPNESLVIATLVEIVIGLISVICLYRTKQKDYQH